MGWVGLGRDFFVVWVGWVHYSKSTKIWKDYVNAFKALLDRFVSCIWLGWDSPVYHALSVHLSRAKLITRFDDRYAVAKFSQSGV